METIHCIGDSHSCFFYGQDDKVIGSLDRNDGLIPFFKVYIVGPSLAYNLCEEGTTTGGREKIFDLLDNKIPPKSTVLLCFGEIDCRAHILKQVEPGKTTLEEAVDRCVARYFAFVEQVRAKGFKVLLWGAVASAHDSAPVDPMFPRIGTCLERNRAARCFNETLKKKAEAHDIPFVSVFEALVAEDGLTREELFMDPIHLSQAAMPLAIAELRKTFGDLPTDPLPVPLRIHVGGAGEKKDWTMLATCAELSTFADASVDEVYVSGQLEKLSHKTQLVPALKEISRVLKTSGQFRFSVPDFDILCRMFVHPSLGPQQRFDTMKLIFGNDKNPADLNKVGLTEEFFKTYLKMSGFCNSRRVSEFKTLRETSVAQVLGQNYMLNIEAIK